MHLKKDSLEGSLLSQLLKLLVHRGFHSSLKMLLFAFDLSPFASEELSDILNAAVDMKETGTALVLQGALHDLEVVEVLLLLQLHFAKVVPLVLLYRLEEVVGFLLELVVLGWMVLLGVG